MRGGGWGGDREEGVVVGSLDTLFALVCDSGMRTPAELPAFNVFSLTASIIFFGLRRELRAPDDLVFNALFSLAAYLVALGSFKPETQTLTTILVSVPSCPFCGGTRENKKDPIESVRSHGASRKASGRVVQV